MITIVVGGFYGDEGKGKVVGYLARNDKMDYVVRAGGGPQAGHTVVPGKHVTQIPSGFINNASKLLIGRGTVLNSATLLAEIEKYEVEDRLRVDYGCTIIDPEHIAAEQELVVRIGSVGTGTGPARAARALRKARLAQDVPELQPFLTDVSLELSRAVRRNKRILVEGVQGFGLSLLDHKFYPYVTSQDTTASQFAADVGLGPKTINEVIVVFKAYISRVGQGPLRREWTAEEEVERGIEERGTVSGRKRRLADFDTHLASDALWKNSATQMAITAIDRLFPGNDGVQTFEALTDDAQEFLEMKELSLRSALYSRGLTLISTGPNLEDMIDLRKTKKPR